MVVRLARYNTSDVVTPLMIRFGIFFAFAACLLSAQTPSFDVASVKACKPGEGPGTINLSPKALNLSCFPVKYLISMAYGETINGRHDSFPMDHIEGGPSWIEMDPPAFSNTYAINARTDHDTSRDTGLLMFRHLLEERFSLKVRREVRPSPVYSLVVDKRGSKLKSFDGTARYRMFLRSRPFFRRRQNPIAT